MNFPASAALQLRSIRALMLRRIRGRYWGSRAGYLWAFVELLAWVFILKIAMTHGNPQRPPLGTSHEVFFINGVVLARSFRTPANSASVALTRAGRQNLPAMNRLDAAYANWLLDMATGGIVMVVALVGLGIFGFDATPDDPLTCLVAFAAASFFALGFGLVFALVLTVVPGLEHFKGILMIVLFMTSGFAILLDRAPPRVRAFFSWNPIAHCIEWFREGFYAGYTCVTLDRTYVLGVTIALLMIGLAGERALRRRSARAET